ncbi:MAG: hypothetical protein ACLTY5_04595 [Angelakisella sp.]
MKHSHSRSRRFWRTFTLSLAAAGPFRIGLAVHQQLGPREGPLPESHSCRMKAPGSTVLALGVSPENELSLCALLSPSSRIAIAVPVGCPPAPSQFGGPK